MSNDYLVEKVERDCPFCDKEHEIEVRKRTAHAIVDDELVDYEQVYFRCPLSDNEEDEFVSLGMMDENMARAREAYRLKNSD